MKYIKLTITIIQSILERDTKVQNHVINLI